MFIKMSKIKENEMDLIAQRKTRINKIQNDINLLEHLNGMQITEFMKNVNFEYVDDEMPHRILYESSDMDSLKEQSSNENSSKSIMQSELQQSFYNQALMDMMNGVLEVCWEDELKKNLPKPLCMENKPDEYDFKDEEKIEIRKYHEKLERLESDRVAHIQQLLNEKIACEKSIQHQVKQLNRCLDSLLMVKVQGRFVICAEELKILIISMDRLNYLNFCAQEKQLLYVSTYTIYTCINELLYFSKKYFSSVLFFQLSKRSIENKN